MAPCVGEGAGGFGESAGRSPPHSILFRGEQRSAAYFGEFARLPELHTSCCGAIPGLSVSASDEKQPMSQFAACLPLQLVVSYIIGLRHMPPTPYDPRSGILENTRRRPEWILENSLFGQIRVGRCRWQGRVGGTARTGRRAARGGWSRGEGMGRKKQR